MRSRRIAALRAACLVAALAAGGLWVRSHRVSDEYNWPVRSEAARLRFVSSRAVYTTPGRLVFGERCAFT